MFPVIIIAFLLLLFLPSKSNPVSIDLQTAYNYASAECAARILGRNKGSKGTHSLLVPFQRDSYMMNRCSEPEKFVIIELCQDIRIEAVVLASYEMFASLPKRFSLSVKRKLSASSWHHIGSWEAVNIRKEQIFFPPLPNTQYVRFVRVDFETHHGNEYYCVVSEIRIYGKTMMEDFEEEAENHKNRQLLLGTTISAESIKIMNNASPPVQLVYSTLESSQISSADNLNCVNLEETHHNLENQNYFILPTKPEFDKIVSNEKPLLNTFIYDPEKDSIIKSEDHSPIQPETPIIDDIQCPQLSNRNVLEENLSINSTQNRAQTFMFPNASSPETNVNFFKSINDRIARLEILQNYEFDNINSKSKVNCNSSPPLTVNDNNSKAFNDVSNAKTPPPIVLSLMKERIDGMEKNVSELRILLIISLLHSFALLLYIGWTRFNKKSPKSTLEFSSGNPKSYHHHSGCPIAPDQRQSSPPPPPPTESSHPSPTTSDTPDLLQNTNLCHSDGQTPYLKSSADSRGTHSPPDIIYTLNNTNPLLISECEASGLIDASYLGDLPHSRIASNLPKTTFRQQNHSPHDDDEDGNHLVPDSFYPSTTLNLIDTGDSRPNHTLNFENETIDSS